MSPISPGECPNHQAINLPGVSAMSTPSTEAIPLHRGDLRSCWAREGETERVRMPLYTGS